MHVAAYIEQHPGSPQTIKQHLAAIKMLFDYLVISQIVPVNPAAPVKGSDPCRQTRQNAGIER
jgi:integrase/recombinase XerD